MTSLIQDIRFGFRMLLKNPNVSIFAALALAIGIGANTALFSLIYSVLLSPLPFPQPEEIMWVQTTWRGGGQGNSSGPDYLDWVEQNTVFQELCAMQTDCKFSLTGMGEPKALLGIRATTNFFDAIGGTPALGRGFLPEESEGGKERVAVLSDRLWKNLFASDPNIVGKKIALGEEPWTVIGVAPPMMGFIEEMAQLFVPFKKEDLNRNRGSHSLGILGRLKEGASLDQAQAEMSLIANRLEEKYVDSNKNKGVIVQPLKEMLVREIKTAFLILYGAVGFLLLIACVNVANLLLAKAGSRSKEIAIRTALGAGRWRIFRQALTESVVLSLFGGCLGLMFALWGLDALRFIAPRGVETGGVGIPGFDEIGIDPAIMGFTLVLSLMTGLLFGVVPAWQISKSKINEILKEGGRGSSSGSSRHRILGGLVIAEIALALILLMGAGLLIASFYNLQNATLGFDPNHVLAAQIERPSTPMNQDWRSRARFFNRIVERIAALPGVESAAAINMHPLTPYNSNNSFIIEGRPRPVGEFITAEYRTITPDYFKTMNIPLIKGRFFTDDDKENNKIVTIVNEEFVRRFLPKEEPIGMRIEQGGQLKEIVGVVGDVKLRSLNDEVFTPFTYIPVNQDSWLMMTLVARVKGEPLALASALRREIWDADPNQPILWIRTMNQIVGASVSVQRFCMILLSAMAGVALLLAIIGIYGVMAFSVQERTHEIGIRMALGAQVPDILKMIVKKGFFLTCVGLTIGLAGGFAATRLMRGMLYRIDAADPLTYIFAAIVLLLVAMLACYIPARKAAKTDPMVTLRCE
ncbi:MAG: ABC transporter permease [Candidatus Omnitrophota bacterium]